MPRRRDTPIMTFEDAVERLAGDITEAILTRIQREGLVRVAVDPVQVDFTLLEPVAVTRRAACRMLGVSLSTFEREVQPHLRLVSQGRLRLVPVDSLREWVRENTSDPGEVEE